VTYPDHNLAPHRHCQPIPGRHLPALAGRLASLARIVETDRLIDQIVYKLHGLSDEKIWIVEDCLGE